MRILYHDLRRSLSGGSSQDRLFLLDMKQVVSKFYIHANQSHIPSFLPLRTQLCHTSANLLETNHWCTGIREMRGIGQDGVHLVP